MTTLRVLERSPCFARVDASVLSTLADASETFTVKRGDVLWHAGSSPQAFHVVRCGLLKLVRPLPRGRSAICSFVGAPESVGDLPAWSGRPYPASAVVITDKASIIRIPRALVIEAAERHPQLATSMTCAIHDRVAALHQKIEVLSAGAVEARLATLLLQLYDRFGDELEDGTFRVPVALSRQELADLVATSFETAIRVMSRWERHGVLSTDHEGFTLRDLDVLHTATGELRVVAVAAE